MDYYATLREEMVVTQLEARDITNPEVLQAMRMVPRHRFVDRSLWHQAYDDRPLPIGQGQTISQPYMVALMTQCLQPSKDHGVLEVGTGSGYQAAILAEIVRQVFTIERNPELSQKAQILLEELGYRNIRFKIGDGTLGWEQFSPYDRILVTAGAPDIPTSLLDQLSDSGKMVIPVGGAYYQDLMLIEKEGKKVRKRDVCGCTFVPLVGKQGWEE
ncbi:MAG: protein-L-isoaspartate(D-aspartate) O-methyltransferase [Candidatus Latescibacteria bacterium]|nr:protein-L-isoaspartate(D-aspartate) O-methyltransferase [Candidatus Latescibacterota bacterium]